MVLTDVAEDGKVLYAVALENHVTKRAGFEYCHARSQAEVVNQLLQSKSLRPDTRIVAIAPAVGVRYTVDEKRDEVKDVIV